VFAVIDLSDIHLMMEADTLGGAKSGSSAHYRLANIKPVSKKAFEENRATLLATLPQMKKPKNDDTEPQTANPKLRTTKGVLGDCIPNPTNGNATISYEIFIEGVVEIQIYNAMGQVVKNLPQGTQKMGYYQTKIHLSSLPAGLYHYTLFVNGERTDSKKVVVN
jgi:type IV secretory pathway VirB10-like protein